MVGRLNEKVTIVTGGARGIGEGIVELFVEEGAKVVIADISPDGETLAKRLGPNAAFKRTDVTVESDVEAVVAFAVERFGRLDVMVNNAGALGDQTPLLDLDAEGFNKTCTLLLRSAALGHKFAARQMKAQGQGGSIVSISSIAGIEAGWSAASYDAAKAGIVQLARSATYELGRHKIRSNVVCPGLILTPIIATACSIEPSQYDAFVESIAEPYGAIIPVREAGRPRDIAEAVLFFASDGSRHVTGQTLAVDGGLTSVTGFRIADVIAKALEDFNARTGKDKPTETRWLPTR